MTYDFRRCIATIGGLGCVLLASLPAACMAQAKKPAASAPKPHNRFVTVLEFRQAKRPAGTLVSIEGYFVSVLKDGRNRAACALVDSTDQVLSALDAVACAKGGVLCTVELGGKSKPRWVMTRKGLLSLAMYTGASSPTTFLQDTPPKLRVQGITGKGRPGLQAVTKIEYQDASGEWKSL